MKHVSETGSNFGVSAVSRLVMAHIDEVQGPYNEVEFQACVELFQILIRWRAEGRKSGKINW